MAIRLDAIARRLEAIATAIGFLEAYQRQESPSPSVLPSTWGLDVVESWLFGARHHGWDLV